MANNAIGIKFQVAGGGSVSGESGQIIKQQLSSIVNQINRDGTLALKFSVDINKLIGELNNLKKIISQFGASGSNGNGGNGGGNRRISEFTEAKKVAKQYYSDLAKLEAAASKSSGIVKKKDGSGFLLSRKALESEKILFDRYRKSRESFDKTTTKSFSPEQITEYESYIKRLESDHNLSSAKSQEKAGESWKTLTNRVREYANEVRASGQVSNEMNRRLSQMEALSRRGSAKNYSKLSSQFEKTKSFGASESRTAKSETEALNEAQTATEKYYQSLLNLRNLSTRTRGITFDEKTGKVALDKKAAENKEALKRNELIFKEYEAQLNHFIDKELFIFFLSVSYILVLYLST